MNKTITRSTSRFLLPLAVAAAIIGGGFVTTMNTGDADAALKWRENVVKWNVKEEKCHKNDPCATTTDPATTDGTTDTTTTP